MIYSTYPQIFLAFHFPNTDVPNIERTPAYSFQIGGARLPGGLDVVYLNMDDRGTHYLQNREWTRGLSKVATLTVKRGPSITSGDVMSISFPEVILTNPSTGEEICVGTEVSGMPVRR